MDYKLEREIMYYIRDNSKNVFSQLVYRAFDDTTKKYIEAAVLKFETEIYEKFNVKVLMNCKINKKGVAVKQEIVLEKGNLVTLDDICIQDPITGKWTIIGTDMPQKDFLVIISEQYECGYPYKIISNGLEYDQVKIDKEIAQIYLFDIENKHMVIDGNELFDADDSNLEFEDVIKLSESNPISKESYNNIIERM